MTNHARGFLERKRPGHAGGGGFSHAVSDHGGRPDAPLLPERGQGHLDGKNGRLRDLRVVQSRVLLIAGQFLQQRPADVRADQPVDRGELGPEDWFLAQQFTAHAGPLRSLAAKNEDRSRWSILGFAARGPRGTASIRRGCQGFDHGRAVGADGQAVRQE